MRFPSSAPAAAAHARQSSAGAAAGLHSTSRHARFAAARQASVDVAGDNGCCLVKALISNLLTFATRSRRKGADLAAGGGGREASQPCKPCNNGNGVCPVPETTALNNPVACTSSQKKTGVISFSQTGSAKSARKTVQSVDTCVADSFDDQMVDKICALPKGLEKSEWLATHVLALFEHVNCISATLSEVCTPVTCSVMSFPGNMKASWVDERGKRHNYSAMRYIDSVMSFCEASRKNQQLFPTKYGATFCADFDAHCSRMVRLLWHCCGHMFSKHWDHLGALNLRPQFGLVLAHLAKLAKQYSLLPEKECASMASTLQLVRPPPANGVTGPQGQQQQQIVQRPSKRALEDNTTSTGMNTATTNSSSTSTVQGRIQQQQQKKAQKEAGKKKQSAAAAALIAMKSGSWGGHSAATVLSAARPAENINNNDLLANCQKCYAQTC